MFTRRIIFNVDFTKIAAQGEHRILSISYITIIDT